MWSSKAELDEFKLQIAELRQQVQMGGGGGGRRSCTRARANACMQGWIDG